MQANPNSCTSLADYRQRRKFEIAREELIKAVLVLQDAEIYILRSQVSMEEAGGTHPAIIEDLKERAGETQLTSAQCAGFVRILSMRLGYDFPFSELDPEES